MSDSEECANENESILFEFGSLASDPDIGNFIEINNGVIAAAITPSTSVEPVDGVSPNHDYFCIKYEHIDKETLVSKTYINYVMVAKENISGFSFMHMLVRAFAE